MPRGRPTSLASRFAALAEAFAAQIEQVVRDELVRAVEAELSGVSRRLLRRRGAPRAGGRTFVMQCPVEGCDEPSRGPRYNFFCAAHHASLSAAQRARVAAEAKARRAGAKALKAAR